MRMGIFPEKDSCTDVHDGFLRRFLRARRFNLSKALAMYMAAQEWRQRESVNHLYDNFDYSRARQAFKLHYPSYIHKTDRSGSPVHIHELSKIDLSGVSSFRIVPIVSALLQPSKPPSYSLVRAVSTTHQLFKTITREEAVQYLFLLSESNLRTRFPACTLQLRPTVSEGGVRRILLSSCRWSDIVSCSSSTPSPLCSI